AGGGQQANGRRAALLVDVADVDRRQGLVGRAGLAAGVVQVVGDGLGALASSARAGRKAAGRRRARRRGRGWAGTRTAAAARRRTHACGAGGEAGQAESVVSSHGGSSWWVNRHDIADDRESFLAPIERQLSQ